MIEAALQPAVGGRLVGVDGGAGDNGFFDHADQCGRVGALDHGGLDLPAALAHPGDRNLADRAAARARQFLHHCQFRGYHKALTIRRGFKRATVATAHKMLRVIFRVLTTRTPYRDPETDYEAMMVKRNAPRWIAMLKKHGIDPATWSPRMPAAA